MVLPLANTPLVSVRQVPGIATQACKTASSHSPPSYATCFVRQPTLWVPALLQKRMAFYNDQENVVSAAMTVVQNLMDKYKIDPRSIGRYSVLSMQNALCALHHVHAACPQHFDKRWFIGGCATMQTGGRYRKQCRQKQVDQDLFDGTV